MNNNGIKTTWSLVAQADKRELHNVVRNHAKFADKWRKCVLDSWTSCDEHDPDADGMCVFTIASTTELWELLRVIEAAHIAWYMAVSIGGVGISANAGLGFRKDDDITGQIDIDWNKLNDAARIKVNEAIRVLESVIYPARQ